MTAFQRSQAIEIKHPTQALVLPLKQSSRRSIQFIPSYVPENMLPEEDLSIRDSTLFPDLPTAILPLPVCFFPIEHVLRHLAWRPSLCFLVVTPCTLSRLSCDVTFFISIFHRKRSLGFETETFHKILPVALGRRFYPWKSDESTLNSIIVLEMFQNRK